MLKRRLHRLQANVMALRGKTKAERKTIREEILLSYRDDFLIQPCKGSDLEVTAAVQDMYFPPQVAAAKRLMVVLVPETNAMSGGIFSCFSIAHQMRRLSSAHGYEVVVMTLPTRRRHTYFRNTNFHNAENVFRFEQILDCKQVSDLYIHIPEYAVEDFDHGLTDQERDYLGSRDRLAINVLNQNITMMPEREALQSLFSLTPHVSQSVAHHAYYSQELANRYQLPTLLLPAYTDLSAYMPTMFKDKERLVIYSLDEAPHKQKCLDAVARRFPDFKLVEIRGVTFDVFMGLATRCMFSITFGEGFDGYLAQPIQQGGVGFAVYNAEFFPSAHFLGYENIFANADDMVDMICDRMLVLMNNPDQYNSLSQRFQAEYKKLYSLDNYVQQIRKLCLRRFELLPEPSALV